MESLLPWLFPKLKLRNHIVGVLTTIVQSPMSQQHQLKLLLNHDRPYFLIFCLSLYKFEEIFIFIVLLTNEVLNVDNVLVLFDWVKFENLSVAPLYFFVIFEVTRSTVDNEIGQTHDPPPKHVLSGSIQLRTQLVKYSRSTVCVKRASVIFLEFHFLLKLKLSIIL
jgi:hypothetical protein